MVISLVGGDSYDLVASLPEMGNVSTQNIYFNCNSTAGAITINLPEISTLLWAWSCRVHVIDTAATADTNAITINVGGSDKINGASSFVVNQERAGAILEIMNDTNWFCSYSASESNAKVWIGTLTQSSSSAPSATVIKNTFGGTITWARSADGIYTGTLTGAFTQNKTSLQISLVNAANGAAARQVSAVWTDANTITIHTNTIDSGGLVVDAAGVLNGNTLQITVQP